MAKRLTRTVFVGGIPYGPSSSIPADVAKRITNPDVWIDDDGADAPPPGVQDPAPPARPSGEPPSDHWTVKELRAFAKAEGITLGDAKSKEAILDVLNGNDPEIPAGEVSDEDPADEDPADTEEADEQPEL